MFLILYNYTQIEIETKNQRQSQMYTKHKMSNEMSCLGCNETELSMEVGE